ncbi:hypothetical protein BDA99DRAFT_565191 [Phascolomyces articulosus]|uniref:F-box domain-containing protein n=1 Tax=Phascolomyces articulosus TaxID=60185 RepID=A0AAD5JZ18_9FUNG|nr:hypothetical protein BDA99DRAFT_565191 [Phascolomyces articulosus]
MDNIGLTKRMRSQMTGAATLEDHQEMQEKQQGKEYLQQSHQDVMLNSTAIYGQQNSTTSNSMYSPTLFNDLLKSQSFLIQLLKELLEQQRPQPSISNQRQGYSQIATITQGSFEPLSYHPLSHTTTGVETTLSSSIFNGNNNEHGENTHYPLELRHQPHHEESKKLFDFIDVLPYEVLIQVFSFIKTKKDCFIAMSVSKRWLNLVPGWTAHVWESDIQLNGSHVHVFKNSMLLHRCLGQHVRSFTIDTFHNQQDILHILDFLAKHQCTRPIAMYYNNCSIQDWIAFQKYLPQFTQEALVVEFIDHDGPTLHVRSMIEHYPNLESFTYTMKQHDKSRNSSDGAFGNLMSLQEPSSIKDISTTSPLFKLTRLSIGIDADCELYEPSGPSIHCSSHDLAFIIGHSPFLTSVVLAHTGDNIAPIVINSIARLSLLEELGLFFDHEDVDSENQHQQHQYDRFEEINTELVALFAKHAALGERSPLLRITLNHVNDTIIYLIALITFLVDVTLTDESNQVTDYGILQFSRVLRSFSMDGYNKSSIQKLALNHFDLQDYRVLHHLSFLEKLMTVDFSDSFIQKDGYCDFIKLSKNLQSITQPLHCLEEHDDEESGTQEVTQLTRTQDASGQKKKAFQMVWKNDIPILDYNMEKKRNTFIVMTDDLQNRIEKLCYNATRQ